MLPVYMEVKSVYSNHLECRHPILRVQTESQEKSLNHERNAAIQRDLPHLVNIEQDVSRKTYEKRLARSWLGAGTWSLTSTSSRGLSCQTSTASSKQYSKNSVCRCECYGAGEVIEERDGCSHRYTRTHHGFDGAGSFVPE